MGEGQSKGKASHEDIMDVSLNITHADTITIALSGQCPAEEPICPALRPQQLVDLSTEQHLSCATEMERCRLFCPL